MNIMTENGAKMTLKMPQKYFKLLPSGTCDLTHAKKVLLQAHHGRFCMADSVV